LGSETTSWNSEFCYFVIHAVAWPSADQSGSGQLAAFVEQFVDLTT
jgi:hypothetical protein